MKKTSQQYLWREVLAALGGQGVSVQPGLPGLLAQGGQPSKRRWENIRAMAIR